MEAEQGQSTGRPVPFTDEELFDFGPPVTLREPYLSEVAFPLGGIGTGCISYSGRGALVDWEIFNRPHKGYRPDHTYFVLHARSGGGPPVFRVLEGRLQPPYQGWSHGSQIYRGFGFGPPFMYGSGFLRFADCAFTGYFPFCRLDLADDSVPVRVSIEAWSPFIPLRSEDSSLPVAIFAVSLTNTTARPVSATVALGLENIVGWPEVGASLNRWVEHGDCRGILMTTELHEPASPRFGSIALLTPDRDATYQLRFADTRWFAATESLMDEFGATGEFSGPRDPELSPRGEPHVAHLGVKAELGAGETARRTFVLAWYNPNFEKYWGGDSRPVWKTYYGVRWPSAEAVGREVIGRLGELERESRQFADCLYSSTLPRYVLDAVGSQLSILRTPTVTRLPDGTVYGFEGCHAEEGCCEGSCTHVWAYAQAMAYLFPDLERGMREMDYAVNLREEDGHMQFRTPLPPGTKAEHSFHAAADGQMGNVLRVYREWQISGDEGWLRCLWPGVRKSLEYAWVEWDQDRDGLIEGVHHNTLDVEYYGPEPVCQTMYLAALRAGEEMARHLGDDDAADEYRRLFESGSTLTDERLFNGEYYWQLIPEGCEEPYQYGPGCNCDQVLGQWHARMLGLGDLLDPDHVRSAISSVFRHNFRSDFYAHHNPHRVYALNDDKGLLICTWPRGGRPKRSLTYAFECMIGFEYQVGVHLIYEGFLREGLSVCKAVRDRHDGRKRNPYNEFECGSHYARSMANYAYMLSLAGFRYSAPKATLHFAPVLARDDYRTFFSTGGAWGTIEYRADGEPWLVRICVADGELPLRSVVSGALTWRPNTIVVAGEALELTPCEGEACAG